MFKQNLNSFERGLRFALAFWWVGPWSPIYPWAWLNWAIFILGWIALAESFFGYCWLVHLFSSMNAPSGKKR